LLVIWIQEINDRVGSKNVYANAAHPGFVYTNIFASVGERSTSTFDKYIVAFLESLEAMMWSSEDGARTQFYLAAALPDLQEKQQKGMYFHPIAVRVVPNPLAQNVTIQKAAWEFSEKLLKSRGY
jgi:hypothetical protein